VTVRDCFRDSWRYIHWCYPDCEKRQVLANVRRAPAERRRHMWGVCNESRLAIFICKRATRSSGSHCTLATARRGPRGPATRLHPRLVRGWAWRARGSVTTLDTSKEWRGSRRMASARYVNTRGRRSGLFTNYLLFWLSNFKFTIYYCRRKILITLVLM